MCNACVFSLRFKTSLYLGGHKHKQPLYFRGFREWEGTVMYSAELTHFIVCLLLSIKLRGRCVQEERILCLLLVINHECQLGGIENHHGEHSCAYR